MTDASRSSGTAGGLLALLIWSTTVGTLRLLAERMGAMPAGAIACTLAGAIGCAIALATPTGRRDLRAVWNPRSAAAGALFAGYNVALFLAIGLAGSREGVLEVGVINYLWPGLMLLGTIPLLGNRARPLLPLGAVAAFAGVVLATWPEGQLSVRAFLASLADQWLPYLLALLAAIAWALYSNLARRWAARVPDTLVFVAFLAAGAMMAVLAAARGEAIAWPVESSGRMVYQTLGPLLAAYWLWNVGMRRGRVALLASSAYAVPILSTAVSCALLGVLPGARLWAGCVLVVAGAVVCKLSVREAAPAGPSPQKGDDPCPDPPNG